MYEHLKETWSELTAPGQMFEVTTVEVDGVPLKAYALAPSSMRDIWLATAGHGDKDYLVYAEERCTYTEAHTYAASIANWLQQQGVKPGDHVAIAMRNYPEWMLAYWAIASMGAVVVGMNAWWVAHEMEYALEDAAPKVMICDKERMLRFFEIRDKFPDLIVTAVRLEEEAPGGVVDWVEVINAPAQLPEATIDPDDDACIFYTSGTTGKPKGAQLTHRGCVTNLLNVGFANLCQEMASARAGTAKGDGSADGEPEKSALIATPLFHVTANNCVAQGVTLVGGKVILMYKWDAGEALRIIEKEKVSVFNAVPMMSRELLMHPDFASRDTSSLLSVGGGGAALQPDLTRTLDKTMEKASPTQGYGMTETCGIISTLSGKFLVDKPDSVGRALPAFEARCVGEDGQPLGPGKVGELCVRGASVIKGYLNRPDATAESIVDGWLYTGDVAYMDEDEFIFLVDRAKDMVLRGGENVYCAEVENALFAQDGVAECVVFAVEDERLGEEVAAVVYPRDGASLDALALRQQCANVIAAFKLPRYLWFVNEPLPRNASGKFVKREVKDALDLADAVDFSAGA